MLVEIFGYIYFLSYWGWGIIQASTSEWMSAKAEELAIVGGFVSFILDLGLSVIMLFCQKLVTFRSYLALYL